MKTLPISVAATDIKNLGAAFYQVNGKMAFAFHIDDYDLKVIFLRTILQCFGDYLIWGEQEFQMDGDFDLTYEMYFTDLPVDEFLSVFQDESFHPTITKFHLEK